jgi:hypothetical protein
MDLRRVLTVETCASPPVSPRRYGPSQGSHRRHHPYRKLAATFLILGGRSLVKRPRPVADCVQTARKIKLA